MNRTIRLGLFLLPGLFAAQGWGADPNLCSASHPSECLNGVSGTVTSFDALRSRTPRFERAEDGSDERRQSAWLRPVHLASNAPLGGVGGTTGAWAAWASANRARFDSSVAVAPYDADLKSWTLGVDRLIGRSFTLGMALTGERLDTRTRFNGGGQRVNGQTISAYGAWLVNDFLSVDFNAGLGDLESNQTRIDPASAPGAPFILSGNYDSKRRFWSAAINATRDFGSLTLGGRAGLVESLERQDGYAESGGPSARAVLGRKVALTQAFGGIDLSYGVHRDWQVHASALHRRDLSRDDGSSGGGLPNAVGATLPADRTEMEWALGLRFYGGERFTASVEYIKTTGRDRFDYDALGVLARIEF